MTTCSKVDVLLPSVYSNGNRSGRQAWLGIDHIVVTPSAAHSDILRTLSLPFIAA